MLKFLYFLRSLLLPLVIQSRYLNIGFNTPDDLSRIKINHDKQVSKSTLVSLENPIYVNGIMIDSEQILRDAHYSIRDKNLFTHQRLVTFQNIPGKSFFYTRCAQNDQLIEEYYDDSMDKVMDLDKIPQQFKDYFQAKHFKSNFSEYQYIDDDLKRIDFKCQGIHFNYLHENKNQTENIQALLFKISDYLQSLNNHMKMLIDPSLVNHIKKITKDSQFFFKVNFYKSQVIQFIFEKQFKDHPVLIKTLSIASHHFFKEDKKVYFQNELNLISINKKNKIDDKKDKNQQTQKGELYINNDSVDNINFYQKTQVKKLLFGKGLHQKIQMHFNATFDSRLIDQNQLKQCEVFFLDFVSSNQYVDQEEFSPNDKFKLLLNEVIDIERPSFKSSQHYYGIKYELQPEDYQQNSQNTTISFQFEYQFHFRYREASFNQLYKNSVINQHPYIYINCMIPSDQSPTFIEELGQYVAGQQFTSLNYNMHIPLESVYKFYTSRKIPTGNSSIKENIMYTTYSVTISTVLVLAYFILNKENI